MAKPYGISNLLTFSRASPGMYLGSDGKYHQAAVDEPRFAYNGDGSFRGLMKEAQQTNILTESSDFSQSWITHDGARVNATSIIEGQSASKLTADGSGDGKFEKPTAGVLSSGKETMYIIVENVDSDDTAFQSNDKDSSGPRDIVFINFNWATETLSEIQSNHGTLNASGYEKLSDSGPSGGKAYLLWFTYTADNPGNTRRLQVYTSGYKTTTQSAIVHHCQVVEDSVYTSPIITQGSQVTRAEDQITIPDTSFVSDSEGTALVHLDWQADVNSYNQSFLQYGSHPRMPLGSEFNGTWGVFSRYANTGGGVSQIIAKFGIGSAGILKAAAAWGNGSLALFINGNKVGENSDYQSIKNGQTSGSLGNKGLKMYFKDMQHFQKRLSDQELLDLTS